jgi:hypothetical protein
MRQSIEMPFPARQCFSASTNAPGASQRCRELSSSDKIMEVGIWVFYRSMSFDVPAPPADVVGTSINAGYAAAI